jgi:predicted GNAT family acetyltransferase
MAKIEYSLQERKIFLTKLIVPEELDDVEFNNVFIKTVLDSIQERNLRVVPTSPKIASFLRKNKQYKDLLPVGVRI